MRGIQRSVLIDAIKTFGVDNQLNIAIEEMSELTKAICKVKRQENISNEDYNAICEELADVIIMMEQLKLIFSNTFDVENYIDQKINRLSNRITEYKIKNTIPIKKARPR